MQQQAYVQRAIPEVYTHFKDNYGRPLRRPYYMRQLQVLHEKDFFPWIVTDALGQLVDQDVLSRIDFKTPLGKNISFYVNRTIDTPSYRPRLETRLNSISSLVDSYSSPTVTQHLGKHLESLVYMELRAQGFEIVGEHTNKYKGRKWTKTDHDLDFIAEHNSGNLNIGVEVKNQLGVIRKSLLTTKLNICGYLGLTPVMAVRWIKPYVELIRSKYGGFAWMFKSQIFPLTYEEFVEELREKLALPVSVNTILPIKTRKVFQRWVKAST